MFTEIYRLHSTSEEPARKRSRVEARPAKVTLSLKVTEDIFKTVTSHTVTLCNERFETFARSKITELKQKLATTTSKEKKDNIDATIKQLEEALEKAKAADRVSVPTEGAIECVHSMPVNAVHRYPYYVRQTHYEHAPVFNNHGFTLVADVYYDWDSHTSFHYIRNYNIDKDHRFRFYTERTDIEIAWLMDSIPKDSK